MFSSVCSARKALARSLTVAVVASSAEARLSADLVKLVSMAKNIAMNLNMLSTLVVGGWMISFKQLRCIGMGGVGEFYLLKLVSTALVGKLPFFSNSFPNIILFISPSTLTGSGIGTILCISPLSGLKYMVRICCIHLEAKPLIWAVRDCTPIKELRSLHYRGGVWRHRRCPLDHSYCGHHELGAFHGFTEYLLVGPFVGTIRVFSGREGTVGVCEH